MYRMMLGLFEAKSEAPVPMSSVEMLTVTFQELSSCIGYHEKGRGVDDEFIKKMKMLTPMNLMFENNFLFSLMSPGPTKSCTLEYAYIPESLCASS